MTITSPHLIILELTVTVIIAFVASSGFWLFIEKKQNNKDITRRLLIGLAHDRIVFLSMRYINRGWVTQDEYENLCQFLYQPYIEYGGNGAVKRLMIEVDKLPIVQKNISDMKGNDNDSQQQGL